MTKLKIQKFKNFKLRKFSKNKIKEKPKILQRNKK
jgi:hypothetical protein